MLGPGDGNRGIGPHRGSYAERQLHREAMYGVHAHMRKTAQGFVQEATGFDPTRAAVVVSIGCLLLAAMVAGLEPHCR